MVEQAPLAVESDAVCGLDAVVDPVSLAKVTDRLGIDKSSASRRVKQAIKLGYLVNEEPIKGKPLRLVLGDPLPDEVQVLPTVEELAATMASVAL